MCGIAGVASTNQGVVGSAGLAALRHRGPDGEGTQRLGGEGWHVELQHTRLAIVDLSDAGLQPMATPDGRFVMVFNGEIYNFPELRAHCKAAGHTFRSSMDGEVILHLWEDLGSAALDELNGIFAVAVVDTHSGEVVLARDPVGVKPLFYATDGESLWFASELRALAAAGAPMGGDDVVALAQFLTFLWVPDPRTTTTGASALLPGHVLHWQAGRTTTARFASPLVPEPVDRPVGLAEAAEQVRAAVDRQLLADVPIGLMASGGVDSGLLWWAGRHGIDRAFTITWQDDGDEGLSDDTVAVRALAAAFGTPVRELPGEDARPPAAPAAGDLLADPAHELTALIAGRARAEGYKVLLSGQGGDELFGGYRRHAAARWIERVRLGRLGDAAASTLAARTGGLRAEYVARLARAAGQRDPFAGYMQLCSYSTAPQRARLLGCTEREVTDEVVWARHRDVFDSLPSGLSFFRKATALDLNVYMPGLGLTYVDRAGMSEGVEVRVPLLDLELVRWALRLPDRALLHRGRGKLLARRLADDVLPKGLGNRPKRPFGAPAKAVADPAATAADGRGFRQDRYLARALDVLAQRRAEVVAAER